MVGVAALVALWPWCRARAAPLCHATMARRGGGESRCPSRGRSRAASPIPVRRVTAARSHPRKGKAAGVEMLLQITTTKAKVVEFVQSQGGLFASWADSFAWLNSLGVKTSGDGETRHCILTVLSC
ncbi:hypothetical protein ACP70R_004199 [Stipagrostis hirtigluma subsp. patula]